MKRTMIHWLVGVGGFCLSAQVWSFNLSPCLRALTLQEGQLSQEELWGWNGCRHFLPERFQWAVHEHMTLAAIKQYRGKADLIPTPNGWRYEYMTEPAWSQKAGRKHLSHGIMFGNWWNDDPLMLTWGQRWDIIKGAQVAIKYLKGKDEEYQGAGSNCSVRVDQHLGRWSHLGQLQHLHFMTNREHRGSTAEQRITTTTGLALSWMKFAYRVAIGDIKPDQPLTEELERQAGLPSIALNHCVKERKNVKVRTIFTLRDPSWSDDYRRAMTPEVALGSMLHVMQDSFSPAHTCRVQRQTNHGLYAVVADVENYNEQVHDSHGSLDTYPPWLVQQVRSGTHMFKNDPVAVGAWLLEAVDKSLPWEQVEAHLRRTIFLSGDTNDPDLKCIGGRALKR